MGRKSTFNDKAAAEIVERLAKGEPLTQICLSENLPAWRTVYDWSEANPAFAAAIARARSHGFDVIASDCLTIADEKDGDPQRDRLRVDTRLKLLAKWDPKRYGDLLKLGGDERLAPMTVVTGVPRADG